MPILTNITITAYCACKLCCSPTAPNLTSYGTTPTPSHTIAGPRVIQLGTKVRYAGSTYTLEDRLAKRFDSRFDIFFSSHKEARQFGIRTNQTVELIK